MRVAVAGLWHLGCVTAAGLASAGHRVIGFDPDPERIAELRRGRAPLREPGLDSLIEAGLAAGTLSFTADVSEAAAGAEVLWVTADTPLDDEDRADLASVTALVASLAGSLARGTWVLVSSQVPAGFTRSLERTWGARGLRFAYAAENLRLGQAVEAFLRPGRVVVGTRGEADRAALAPLFEPLGWTVEWLDVESAEMTKHALNGFLSMSASFANELARVCEAVGADAKQVERALRGDPRVGPRAYVAPGPPFAGGTLARDLRYLSELAHGAGVAAPLVAGVLASNEAHVAWLHDAVLGRLAGVARPVAAVLGLVYKPGTSTLRRSTALDLCDRLRAAGVLVRAHDPGIEDRRHPRLAALTLCGSAREALAGADVALIATPWPEYQQLSASDFVEIMRAPRVVDPGWFLADALAADTRVDYRAVGRPPAV
jgi:UDPglucose 6-dehydrogenase